MQIVFTTNRKMSGTSIVRRRNWEIQGHGAIGGIIGSFAEPLGTRKKRPSGGKLTGVEVQSRPKLSDDDVKSRNDQASRELDTQLDHMESLEKHFRPDGTVVVVLRRRKKELYETGSQFVELYHEQHGVQPPEPLRKKVAKYDSDILAQAYLAFVLKTGRPEPSQDELSNFAPGSQATWSRYFREPEFWDQVMKRLETIWQAHSIAKQRYERAETNKEKERRSGVEPETVSSSGERGSKKTPTSNTEEANITALVDLRMRYEKMDRPALIKKLLACDPEMNKAELEEQTQEYLVELAIDLAA